MEDIGRVLNPLLVHGQIHGGVAQGIGQALCEQVIYDPGSAQLLSGSFMDYAMPHAEHAEHHDRNARGADEGSTRSAPKADLRRSGTIGALSATINAVCDALAPLGVRHLEMPATPERVWVAIRNASRQG